MSRAYEFAAELAARKATGAPPHWWGNVADEYRYSTEPNRTPASLYQKLTWIATAIDVPAQMAAGTPLEIYQDTQDGEKKELPGHDFLRLWRKPNELQTTTEFIRDSLSWYKAAGNLYWWLNCASETDAPDELWILPSDRVKPVPDGKMYVKGYTLDLGNSKVFLEPHEICHIKTFNPLNPFIGLSAIESLMYVAGTDLSQQKWAYNLFANDSGKLPAAVMFADRIEDTEWENIRGELRKQWAGEKGDRPITLRGVGKGGVELLQLAANQKEMEFLASRISNRDEIWQRLAPGLANVLDTNVTEANATAGKAILLEFCIFPMLTSIHENITAKILPRYGDGVSAEFEDVRETNRLIDLQEQTEYSKTHTVAEIRKEYYGDEPLGDERDALLPTEIGKGNAPPPASPDMTQPPEQAPDGEQMVDDAKALELRAWENYAVKRLGKAGGREFEPRALDLLTASRVKAMLRAAHTIADVRAVFALERGNQASLIQQAVTELRRHNDIASR